MQKIEKIFTTEHDSLLKSGELSDLQLHDMSLEQEIEASKAKFDRIAKVCLAKPICEKNRNFRWKRAH